MAASLLVYLGALAALVLIWQSQRLKRSKRLPFPPGPKGLPLIGNLFQLPQENAWRFHGTETFEKYGELPALFRVSSVSNSTPPLTLVLIDWFKLQRRYCTFLCPWKSHHYPKLLYRSVRSPLSTILNLFGPTCAANARSTVRTSKSECQYPNTDTQDNPSEWQQISQQRFLLMVRTGGRIEGNGNSTSVVTLSRQEITHRKLEQKLGRL